MDKSRHCLVRWSGILVDDDLEPLDESPALHGDEALSLALGQEDGCGNQRNEPDHEECCSAQLKERERHLGKEAEEPTPPP